MAKLKTEAGEFITSSRLKNERFWTDKLINTHLGEPDRLATNPNYRSGPKMRLYEMKRVVRVEKRKVVAEALRKVADRRAARSATAKRSAQSRRDDLVKEEVSHIETHFEGLSLSRLIKKGMAGRDVVGDVDVATKYRWAVNFARHELTSYDGVRVFNSGRVGVHHAAEAVRNEILNRIARRWPELEPECRRQSR